MRNAPLPCLLLVLLACDQDTSGGRTRELGAQAERQAGRLADKVAGAMDRALQKESYTVDPSPALAEAGLQPTRALRLKEPAGLRGVTVYMVADKAFAGILELRTLDAKGLEVGRARVPFRAEAGSARYLDFPMDPRTPLDEVDRVALRAVR